MTDSNGANPTADVDAALSHITRPLRKLLETLQVSEAELGEQLAATRAERQKVERVLRATESVNSGPKPKAKPATKPNVSESSYADVLAVVRARPNGITTPEICRETRLHSTTVRLALNALRQDDRVRNAGKFRPEGHMGATPTLWKPIGADA